MKRRGETQMIYSFGTVIDAILFVVGGYWCYAMLGRWRSDLEELRTVDDITGRAVIIGLWALTAVIALFVINFAVGLVTGIISGIRGLF